MATIQEILDHVGDDPDRAQHELDHERAADNPRTTLIAQLETIAEKEAPVSDQTAEVEETEEVPEPEQPVEAAIHAGDAGVTVFPVNVRDTDVDTSDASLQADPDADLDDTLIEGEQVELITGAADTAALALSLNGTVYLFNSQMVATLKNVVDKAVVGLSL